MASLVSDSISNNTREKMGKSFLSILVAVANVDGLFSGGELKQLKGGGVTFLKRRNIELDVGVVDDVISNPLELEAALSELAKVPVEYRLSVVEQVVALALADGEYEATEISILHQVIDGLFAQDQQALVNEYINTKLKLFKIRDQLTL